MAQPVRHDSPQEFDDLSGYERTAAPSPKRRQAAAKARERIENWTALINKAEALEEDTEPLSLNGANAHVQMPSGTPSNPMAVDGDDKPFEVRQGYQITPQPPRNHANTETLQALATAFAPNDTFLADAEILGRVKTIAAAPPPFDFPSDINFAVAFPYLTNYISPDGAVATTREYWTFDERHTCGGRDDITAMLQNIALSGDRFRRRRLGLLDQAPEAFLDDLRVLVRETFKLHDVRYFAREEPPWDLQLWRADIVRFVVDHMMAVIEGEKVYVCTESWAVGLMMCDERWVKLVRDRFEAVVERVVHWEKYISAGGKLEGTLIDGLVGNQALMRKLREAFTEPLATKSSSEWPGFRPGHTAYSLPARFSQVNDTAPGTEEILSWLPHVQLPFPLRNTGPERLPPRTDIPASNALNARLDALTRGLIQQSAALDALLATLTQPNSPFASLPGIVQLDGAHGNARSILIFKTAWLVIAQADKLWSVLCRHERKGEIAATWGGRREELRCWLQGVVEGAVVRQVEAAREALWFGRVKAWDQVKYW